MAAGKFLDVPMMTGFTNNEFLTMPPGGNDGSAEKEAQEKFRGQGGRVSFPLLRRRTA